MRRHNTLLVCAVLVCAALLGPVWGQQNGGTTLSAASAALRANGPADPDFADVDTTVLAYMTTRHIPGGAVAVVKDGRLTYTRGYGWADRDRNVPVQPTSLFRIASLSKSITSAAVMTLVQSGRLKLDAPAFPMLGLSPVLAPGASVDPRLMRITLRQILHHTGGWDRDKSGDPMFEPDRIAHAVGVKAPANQEAIIRYMMGRPLDFDPGTHYAYSNFGYCVLGRIIERVSGMPYERYVEENVLRPMGITRMRLGGTRMQDAAPGEVHYYEPKTHLVRSVFPEDGDSPVPECYGGFDLEAMDSHGGWIASAIDLARFATGIDGPTRHLLTPNAAALLYERPPPPVWQEKDGTPSAVYYGCGWLVRPLAGGGANYWHDGSLPGTYTYMVRRADGVTWVALFSQRSEGTSTPDSDIDGALNRAINAVRDWPAGDLFSTAASTAPEPTTQASTPETNSADIRPGEIALSGTVTQVIPAMHRMQMEVRQVTLSDGTESDLQPPRSKVILLTEKSCCTTQSGAKRAISDLHPRQVIRVIGSDTGAGKPLTGRYIEIP